MTTTHHIPTDQDDTSAPGTATAGSTPAAPAPPRRVLPRFDLSATQLIATGLAATTATFAASYLGVAGTVIGAALASVLTAIGNAVYGQSLRSTRDRVREVVPVTRLAPRLHTTATLPVPTDAVGPPPLPSHAVPSQAEPPTLPAPVPQSAAAGGWRRVAIAAIAVFVAVMALVTSVELLTGRPLSDVVRGDTGQGTSFFGNAQATTGTAPAGTPTITRTIIPKVVQITPTLTQTAPAVTQTDTPTITPTNTPSDTPTTSPSASTTGAGSATTSRSPSSTSTPSQTPTP